MMARDNNKPMKRAEENDGLIKKPLLSTVLPRSLKAAET